MSKMINSFDIDGVIFMDKYDGVYPGEDDIIVTGRSYEEAPETYNMLWNKGIYNRVYFNPIPFDAKTREESGHHKALVLTELWALGVKFGIHFEDDPIQADIIKKKCGDFINVVLIQHDLVEKENVRHANI